MISDKFLEFFDEITELFLNCVKIADFQRFGWWNPPKSLRNIKFLGIVFQSSWKIWEGYLHINRNFHTQKEGKVFSDDTLREKCGVGLYVGILFNIQTRYNLIDLKARYYRILIKYCFPVQLNYLCF